MATIRLLPEFREFCGFLNSERVEYLIGLGDLKANKLASGRPKDHDDLQHLP